MLRGVTGVVVANRASTVLLADRVALLENGTITHVGTHSELLATVPRYRYLLAADDELDDDARARRALGERRRVGPGRALEEVSADDDHRLARSPRREVR